MHVHRRPLVGLVALLAVGAGLGVGLSAATFAATSSPSHPATIPFAAHPPQRPAAPTTVYVGVNSCKIASVANLRPGTSEILNVSGSDLSAQGGSATGCKIPGYATSIAGRITAQNVTAPGSFALSPFNIAPNGPSVFLTKGQSSESGFTQAIAASKQGNLTLSDTAGRARITIWVNGYYAQQPEGSIYTGDPGNDPASILSGSTGLVSVTTIGEGQARVTADRDVSNCAVTASPYLAGVRYASANAIGGRNINVATWNIGPNGEVIPENDSLYLTVVC